MEIKKIKNRLYVESEFTTGNRAWLAKIVGKHPKWKYDRVFLNKQRQGLSLDEVQAGDILERVSFSHSGKNRSTTFNLVNPDGTLTEVQESELLEHLVR